MYWKFWWIIYRELNKCMKIIFGWEDDGLFLDSSLYFYVFCEFFSVVSQKSFIHKIIQKIITFELKTFSLKKNYVGNIIIYLGNQRKSTGNLLKWLHVRSTWELFLNTSTQTLSFPFPFPHTLGKWKWKQTQI